MYVHTYEALEFDFFETSDSFYSKNSRYFLDNLGSILVKVGSTYDALNISSLTFQEMTDMHLPTLD